jgi:SAM-dependent methyltransferase
MNLINQFTQRRLRNARQPAGRFGRFLVWAMNVSHSQMTDWGLEQLAIGPQDTILDVGCGGGGTIGKLAYKAARGKVYGVDFSAESVTASRSTNKALIQAGRVQIQQGSVSRLPFPEAMFDLVTAVNTHNYWPDLVNDLREIWRVLKPGGRLLIISSLYKNSKNDQRNRKYAEMTEIAFPGIQELRETFLKAGFTEAQAFEKYQRSWFCCLGRKSA